MRVRNLSVTLVFLLLVYTAMYIWPTQYRYDHLGNTPVRTNRVTGQVEFMTLCGWTPEMKGTAVCR